MEHTSLTDRPSTTAYPSARLVMLAVIDEQSMRNETSSTGAIAYLLPSGDPDVLLAAITRMSQGGGPQLNSFSRNVTLHMHPDRPSASGIGLSHREKDVLGALVEGLSYKMIADKLGISFETVRTHIKRIYDKLRVHNSAEAVAKALTGGLLA